MTEITDALLSLYLDIESEYFRFKTGLSSQKNVDNLLYYKLVKYCVHKIEKQLNCSYKKYVIVEVELSDPHWSFEEIYPDKIGAKQLKELIDNYDNYGTSRWFNPMLICLPKGMYEWMCEKYDGDPYCEMPIYAIAGPNDGYTGLWYEWIQFNKKEYLPKVLNL